MICIEIICFAPTVGSKILLDEDITSRIVDVGKLKEEENKKYIYDKEQEYKQQEKIKYDNLLDQRVKINLCK